MQSSSAYDASVRRDFPSDCRRLAIQGLMVSEMCSLGDMISPDNSPKFSNDIVIPIVVSELKHVRRAFSGIAREDSLSYISYLIRKLSSKSIFVHPSIDGRMKNKMIRRQKRLPPSEISDWESLDSG